MFSEYKYIQQMDSGVCLASHFTEYYTLESKPDTSSDVTGLKHFQYCVAGVPEI